MDEIALKELLNTLNPKDLSWMKETHPQEYSRVIETTNIRDVKLLIDYYLPPVNDSILWK